MHSFFCGLDFDGMDFQHLHMWCVLSTTTPIQLHRLGAVSGLSALWWVVSLSTNYSASGLSALWWLVSLWFVRAMVGGQPLNVLNPTPSNFFLSP
jgi:hypothetical protein